MEPTDALGLLPVTLKQELVDEFNKIARNYREERWEPSELSAGKFCEVVYTILYGYLNSNYPNRSSKPDNMLEACRDLEKYAKTFSRSIRVQIPRVIIAVYEVRNNRGVGHVGGDVSPSFMDATFIFASAKWMMAELIRIFHDVDTIKAENVVEMLTLKETPAIWSIGAVRRVLKKGLSKKDQTLLLLYSVQSSSENELCGWVEHSNPSVFRRDVLVPGHKNRLWEYNRSDASVKISPVGVLEVEKRLLKTLE